MHTCIHSYIHKTELRATLPVYIYVYVCIYMYILAILKEFLMDISFTTDMFFLYGPQKEVRE